MKEKSIEYACRTIDRTAMFHVKQTGTKVAVWNRETRGYVLVNEKTFTNCKSMMSWLQTHTEKGRWRTSAKTSNPEIKISLVSKATGKVFKTITVNVFEPVRGGDYLEDILKDMKITDKTSWLERFARLDTLGANEKKLETEVAKKVGYKKKYHTVAEYLKHKNWKDDFHAN